MAVGCGAAPEPLISSLLDSSHRSEDAFSEAAPTTLATPLSFCGLAAFHDGVFARRIAESSVKYGSMASSTRDRPMVACGLVDWVQATGYQPPLPARTLMLTVAESRSRRLVIRRSRDRAGLDACRIRSLIPDRIATLHFESDRIPSSFEHAVTATDRLQLAHIVTKADGGGSGDSRRSCPMNASSPSRPSRCSTFPSTRRKCLLLGISRALEASCPAAAPGLHRIRVSAFFR